MTKLDWTGRRFEVSVDAVAHGGHCVARHEGRVLFVRHTLPGERVLVEVTDDRGGSFCRADAVSVLSAAPQRVAAPCPYAVPGGCGGCDWQHVAEAAQRELKATVLAEQLHRLAGVDWDVEVEPLAGGPLHWRTRTRLAVNATGQAGFRAHRSHRVVPVADCLIAAPGTVDAVASRTWAPGGELEVALDADAHTHVVEHRRVPGHRHPATSVVAGRERVTERAVRREWTVAATGFWQAHPDAADVYAEVVADWAGLSLGDVAWDLYSGVGLFAAVLAEQVGPLGTVLAVESATAATADARANLADLPQVRVVTGRVEQSLSGAADPRAVILDPPRKGAGRRVVEAIAARHPASVVYVACDPAALARDVATFADHGYRLTALRAFDAFPMTHHTEALAHLTRAP